MSKNLGVFERMLLLFVGLEARQLLRLFAPRKDVKYNLPRYEDFHFK
jgi:hypothetical protein